MNQNSNNGASPVYVTDDAVLNSLCDQWQQCSLLALDTEFVRVDTFYPKVGLIQVGDGERHYLLDPLALKNWTRFIALLNNPSITKVLHSCSEDLVVFKAFFGQLPSPLFDTQRAAAFLGYGFSISYQNLVKEVLGIDISKDQTRSDWTRRPLTAEQCDYAALDVAYLPAICEYLTSKLVEKGRHQWAEEEFQQLLTVSAPETDADNWQDYYLSLGGAWRLESSQLAALQRLCVWREQVTRARNKPRSWIAKDAELIAIAAAMPIDVTALAKIPDLPRPLIAHDGAAIIDILKAPHLGPEPRPELMEQPLNAPMRKALKACQSVVRECAENLDMAPELLARKKQLVPLIYAADSGGSFQWPTALSGWRQTLLEDSIRRVLNRASAS